MATAVPLRPKKMHSTGPKPRNRGSLAYPVVGQKRCWRHPAVMIRSNPLYDAGGTPMDTSSVKTQISLRIPADMSDHFSRIAAALDRDRTWVMLRAYRQYLENEGADILQDAEGLAALDRGDGTDFDEVMDEAATVITQAKAKFSDSAVRKAG